MTIEAASPVTVDYTDEVLGALRDEDVKRIVYVPDSVLAPIIERAGGSSFDLVGVTREEEGVGVMAGCYIGGEKAVLMMQSSGLGNSLNALGSLMISSRIPCPMLISLRGELGDRNYAQVPWSRVAPTVLDLLAVQSVRITDPAAVRHDVAEMVRSAYRWHHPTAALLTRVATGGVDD